MKRLVDLVLVLASAPIWLPLLAWSSRPSTASGGGETSMPLIFMIDWLKPTKARPAPCMQNPNTPTTSDKMPKTTGQRCCRAARSSG